MSLIKTVLKYYKLCLLIALTVGVAVTAQRVERSYLNIILIFAGSIIGTFVLDTEYLLEAYWNNPLSEFSLGLKALFAQKNYAGALTYINEHKTSVQKRMLNSAMFQVILGFLAYFMAVSSGSPFGQALIINAYAQSLFHMYQEYEKTKNVSSWFWFIKDTPGANTQKIYAFVTILFLVYIIIQVQ